MKKIFSILISLVMVFSIMNITVFATEVDDGTITGDTHVHEDGTVHEGAEHVDDEGIVDDTTQSTDQVVEEEEDIGYKIGKIVEAGEVTETTMYGMYTVKMQDVTVRLTEGKFANQEFETSYFISQDYEGLFEAPKLNVGDKVFVTVETTTDEQTGEDVTNAYVVQKMRDTNMLVIGLIVAVLLIVFGRMSGVKTIALIAINTAVALGVLVGLYLNGASAILSLLALVIPIIVTNVIILNGFKRESIVAMLAVLVSTVITIGLFAIFNNSIGANGLTEYGSYISGANLELLQDAETGENKFDYLDIIVAGVIVMSLGATIDMAIRSVKKGSQGKSFSATLKEVSKKLAHKLNSVSIVWLGAFITIFTIFMLYQRPLLEIINVETIVLEFMKLMIILLNVVIVMPIAILLSKELLKQRTLGEPNDLVEKE